MKIVVVDDEEGVRRSLKKVLEKDRNEIYLAEDGSMALEYVRENGQDVETVISDFKMPGMDGLETLIAIGEINADITRILLTVTRPWTAPSRRSMSASTASSPSPSTTRNCGPRFGNTISKNA
jgi:CheY-like chemotaxis protein